MLFLVIFNLFSSSTEREIYVNHCSIIHLVYVVTILNFLELSSLINGSP